MYKSLLDTFNDKQMEVLRSKMWWVADQHKPMLVKFAVKDDFVLLQITDLRALWAARLSVDTLLQHKNHYANSLEIKDKKDLLSLFESLLSFSDSEAVYQFKEQGSEIHFTFQKLITIYAFSWTFKLQKANCNPVELVCREIITPFASVLEAQTKRIDMLKKKFEQIEKEYIRKMTEMEKNLYKSPLLEDEAELLLYLPKINEGMLSYQKFDKQSELLFSSCSLKEKIKLEQLSPSTNAQRKIKPVGRQDREDRFQMAEYELLQDLEAERRSKPKSKKIDFI